VRRDGLAGSLLPSLMIFITVFTSTNRQGLREAFDAEARGDAEFGHTAS